MKKLITLISFLALLLVSCKQETYYNITTKVEPEGSGIVVVTPSTGAVLEGTSVSFLAKPNGDYVFSGWSGGLSGEVNPQTVTVSSDLSVVAKFTLRSYPLTITVEGEGTVSEKVISTRSDFTAGTVVELTANPSEHWLFDHWEGDLNGNTNPAQITVSSSKSVKAVFVKKMYDLTVEIQGHGSVEEKVINTRSGSYEEGTTVELTAIPDEFWAFDHWEDAVEGDENPTTITVSKSSSVRAIFTEKDPGIVYTETEYISPFEINKRLGMGWNLTCQLESYREDGAFNMVDETWWGNPLCTQALFDKAAAAGFKSVRIPITWMGSFGPGPDYLINEDRLNRIAEVIGYAEKAGMNAIINMHHDDCGAHTEGHPYPEEFWIDPGRAAADPSYNEKVKEQLSAMWKQIARKLRDKGDFLMFESFNEPGSGFFWSWATDEEKDAHAAEFQCLNEWNQVFVDAVRSTGGNNASRWLIVVGAAAKERNLDRLIVPKDYVSNNRIMVSIHFYEPEDFALGSLEEWGHTAQISDEEIWRYDETFITTEFQRYKEQYMDRGIPLCVDEIGFSYRDNERGNAFSLYYIEYLVRAAKLNGFATFLWQRLFNHQTGEFYGSAEDFIKVIREAAYDENIEYTLESIYNRAPFNDSHSSDAIVIPDEVFKAYLVDRYDQNGDGEINKNECIRITHIDIDTKEVKSLRGIEFLPNLTTLLCRGREDWIPDEYGPGLLSELDVSCNPHLKVLEFNNNHITKIDLSKNPELEVVGGRSNALTELDISHNPMLTDLDMSINHIETLDFSNSKLLKNIYARGNELSVLNVTELQNLESLNFGQNHLSTIDLSNNPMLKSLECDNNNLSSLDLGFNYHLDFLLCDGNPSLKTMYLAKGHSISHMVKDDYTQVVYRKGVIIKDGAFKKYLVDHFDTDADNEISEAEAASVTEIEVCTDNIYTLGGIEYFVNLSKLSCMGSSTDDHYFGVLSELNLSNNSKLEFLSCGYNQLKSLDVSKNKMLKTLRLQNNDVTTIDVSNNPLLEELVIRFCHLNTSLDFTNNPKLKEIDCQGGIGFNRIKSIDVSKCPLLLVMNCNSVWLETIDVSNNPQLQWLGCVGGLFSSIDLSANTHLNFLYADVSSLHELDLTHNPEIEWLYIRDSRNLQYVYLKAGHTIPNLLKDDHTQIIYR